jgi:hypothetical protein
VQRAWQGEVAMNADLTTVLVAILGVIGTLSSPLLGQRIAARAKQEEFDLQRQDRLETRDAAHQREAFEERRTMYAGLNTAARHYTQELRTYLRMVRDDDLTAEERDRLEKARQTYRDLYSDAQMILPDKVLKAAVPVNICLGDAYGMIKRLEVGKPRAETSDEPADTVDRAHECCSVTLYDLIDNLRQLMRQDLGVSDAAMSE